MLTQSAGTMCAISYHREALRSILISWLFVRVPGKTCPYPGDLHNGQMVGNDYNVGQHVYFKCNNGYSRNGALSSTCQPDGTWSQAAPTCNMVQCQKLPLPNGKARYFGNTLGSSVVYTCNEHTMMSCELKQGYCAATCQENGEWSMKARCDAPCKPYKSRNGKNDDLGHVTHGTKTTIQCIQPRFILWPEGVDPTVHCNNGTWRTNATCIPAPCEMNVENPASTYHGDDNIRYAMGSKVPSGVSVNVVCDPGYKANLTAAQCHHGVWLNKLPTCKLRWNKPSRYPSGLFLGACQKGWDKPPGEFCRTHTKQACLGRVQRSQTARSDSCLDRSLAMKRMW